VRGITLQSTYRQRLSIIRWRAKYLALTGRFIHGSGLAGDKMAAKGGTSKSKSDKELSSTFKETEGMEMDEDEDVIDSEQLEEYQEMVDQLGTFPVSVCTV